MSAMAANFLNSDEIRVLFEDFTLLKTSAVGSLPICFHILKVTIATCESQEKTLLADRTVENINKVLLVSKEKR